MSEFNITIPEYKEFNRANVTDIPKHYPGVYQLFNADKEVVYVGKSKNLGTRIASHFKGTTHTKDHSDEFEYARCYFTKNLMFMDILEIYFINTISPKYNKLSLYPEEEVDRGRVGDKRNNKMWKLEPGICVAYTEDLDVIYKLQRYYLNKEKGFKIMATYHDGNRPAPYAIQFSFPMEKRRSVERLLETKLGA